MIRGRLRRRGGERREPAARPSEYIEIDPRQLTGIFVVPQWLRDVGLTAWLLVGVAVFLVGMVWLLALTQVIVLPLLTAGIVAAVASPLVAWLHKPRRPARARRGAADGGDHRARDRGDVGGRRRDHRRGRRR